MSRSVPAWTICICNPSARAAACAPFVDGSPRPGSLGLTSAAMTLALGTIWCNISTCFCTSSTPRLVTPVTLPPGRLRLATSPAATGSIADEKTIGIVVVAAFAASTEGVPAAAITATCRRTSSAASAGKPIVVTLRPAIFDRHVAAFDEAGLAQAFAECSDIGGPPGWCFTVEKPNYRHRLLLRARRERPRGRHAAERG